MDKVIFSFFVLCFIFAIFGATLPQKDFGASIFGMMFWCIGWIIAFARVRHV